VLFNNCFGVPIAKVRGKKKLYAGYIIIVLMVVASALYIYWNFKESSTESVLKMVPLTSSTNELQWSSSWSPDGSFFSYMSFKQENSDIVVSAIGSGSSIRLTNNPFDEFLPRWSPDGSKIAFVADKGSGIEVYWVAPTGGTARFIAQTGLHMLEQFLEGLYSMGSMPWSPDSKKILFPRLMRTGAIGIWQSDLITGLETQLTNPDPGVIDLYASYSFDGENIVIQRNFNLWLITKSGDEKPLLVDEYFNSCPTWSSDNDKVIFISNRGGKEDIWSISIDEKELKQVTSLNKRVLYPVVTNGGNLGNLVFDIWDHRTDLFSLNLKTKEEKQLTFHHGNNFHPRISPDGESIIYQSDRTGDYEIWQYNLKTENETQLTINPASDIKADWSPDGKSIVFLSNRDKEQHLWIMDIESGKTDRLTTEGIKMPGYIQDYAMNVKWSPDGKTIGYIAQGQNGRSVWLIDPSGENQRIGLGDIHSFDWYLTNNLIVYNRIDL